MIAFPKTKTCGGCGKTKDMLTEFNRVTADLRFYKNICKECEALGAAKFKRPVMTMDITTENIK
jgi:hypothetical protein